MPTCRKIICERPKTSRAVRWPYATVQYCTLWRHSENGHNALRIFTTRSAHRCETRLGMGTGSRTRCVRQPDAHNALRKALRAFSRCTQRIESIANAHKLVTKRCIESIHFAHKANSSLVWVITVRSTTL